MTWMAGLRTAIRTRPEMRMGSLRIDSVSFKAVATSRVAAAELPLSSSVNALAVKSRRNPLNFERCGSRAEKLSS